MYNVIIDLFNEQKEHYLITKEKLFGSINGRNIQNVQYFWDGINSTNKINESTELYA